MIDTAMLAPQVKRAWLGGALVVIVAVALAGAGSGAGLSPDNWSGWGNTPDQNRHSPLTAITPSNVSQLGRVFTVDFRAIDSSIKRGEQSFPLAIDGRLYVTTGDDNVFAVDGVTGAVIWRWKPDNVAVFRNFGIVANRGVAYCDGKLFITTLDMHLVSLDVRTGKQVKRIAIASAVPGAASDFGYSETSAPICANGKVVIGAAGSEYGVRGFVMAYNTNLTPAWPNPFWTIPPEGTSWRKLSRIVGGGVVWTPQTIDPTTNTLYFGTGSATPLYFPQFRPGENPRTDALIAVDLRTGQMKWWQQQMSSNQWAYDTAQPPLVYSGKIGGKTRRIVSVATMEGVWFAYDAATGAPIYQRIKVIDRTEHPSLQPGKFVTVFPSSLGGLNFSPASYDPKTNYIFNAAAETAAVLQQAKLTPTQKKEKLVQGSVFLGLQNGNFGTFLPGWHDHGSISAIDVNSGKRVWKFNTPEPERGGVTTTASGLGFAGDGDGNLRAFDLKTGKVLWTFQTGHQIAAGPSVYSVNGKEYIAITVGGTPTSSGGGTATELQVYALGASTKQSPPPVLASVRVPAVRVAPMIAPAAVPSRSHAPAVVGTERRATALGNAHIATQAGLVVRGWDANSSNTQGATGRVFLGSTPIAGVQVRVDGYLLPAKTAKDGSFIYPADITVPRRHVVTIVSADSGRVAGRALSAAERTALVGMQAGFNVYYQVGNLHTAVQKNGTILVQGHVGSAEGIAPPKVSLFTYRLTGVITDSSGKPVQGAVVVTRTQDRDFWTYSTASDSQGRYTSFYGASDESGTNPVILSVQVAVGSNIYGLPTGVNVAFALLKSATMNVQLPASGTGLPTPKSTSYPGAVYEGLLVGVASGKGVVRPVSARWPDGRGNFSFVLPASLHGKTVRFWEDFRELFQTFPATPGSLVDLTNWPSALTSRVPQGFATVTLPS
jgi:alcohol dehydrogenase (cytochrome c)